MMAMMWKEEARGKRLGNGQGVPEETVENVECVEESVDKRETGRNRVTLHST